MTGTIQQLETAIKAVLDADSITGLTVIDSDESTVMVENGCTVKVQDNGPIEEDLEVFTFAVEIELLTPSEATTTTPDPKTTRHDIFEKIRRVVLGVDFISDLSTQIPSFAFYEARGHAGRHESRDGEAASILTFDLIVGCGE